MIKSGKGQTALRSLTAAGVLLILMGAVMWVLPGPGLPVLLTGAICLAAAGMARLADWPR
ncbi:hypothetical protein [Streptomyces neyagawaensis]|uniref:hypothetical protein n=1 Tax=Streptomyces neyagawaensis TaxID=42238 RepID=UPI000B0598AF|nr:hypothetical protein [Streptomyces neyagawaensis]MCL6738519.1 hypothetical protein [Streptomyces neyagawaensis]MDE1688919.1 hypothetical protein [Streptomyces neyagawaensis]